MLTKCNKHRNALIFSMLALPVLIQTGCLPTPVCESGIYCQGGTAGTTAGQPQVPAVYPLTANPHTSLQQVYAPKEPSPEVRALMNNGAFTVYQHNAYEANGLGVSLETGLPRIEHRELAPGFIEGGAGERKSLAYLWVINDPQITDEESPIRLAGYDKLYRPQAQLTAQSFEAHVRTAQRISDLSTRPFDFALIGGDLIDTPQKNELDWFLTILNGGIVDPDSGIDNDPNPGPGNDYNDPFISDGINFPWYAAMGNHELLYFGWLGLINQDLRNAAVSNRLYTGTPYNKPGWHAYVDGDTADASLIFSPNVFTPADPDRIPLYKNELLQALHDAGGQPAGHGLTQDNINTGKGYYSVYPVDGKPIKMIVLETTDATETNPDLAWLGSMDSNQFGWLQAELVSADLNNELVIMVSHHRLEDFHNQSPVHRNTVKSLLASYNNVVLHLTGHMHGNTKRLQSANGIDGYWELMTASTRDFPQQSRAIELVDEGNGYLSVYITNFDHNSPESSLAHKARQLSAGKAAFGPPNDGDTVAYWAEESQSQNLLLRYKLDSALSNNLAAHTWPGTIETIETLENF